MPWLAWLNPKNWIRILSLIKFILDFAKSIAAYFKEKSVQKHDKEVSDKAIEELRKPVDPTKSVQEREKIEEDKFDEFFKKH